MTVVAVAAVVVAVILVQVQVSAGLSGALDAVLVSDAERSLVVAAPLAALGDDFESEMQDARQRLHGIGGLRSVGVMETFTAPVGAGTQVVPAQVAWAEPAYLRVVAQDSSWMALAHGSAALVPDVVRKELGIDPLGHVNVGASTVFDVGDPPDSFLDASLRNSVLIAPGRSGATASYPDGTVAVAVIFDHVPSDGDVRLVQTALSPDHPRDVAVVSRGTVPTRSVAATTLAGRSGRLAVVALGVAGWVIVAALQLVMAHRRRGEVALRMALGATSREVAGVSFLEASLLGAFGGALGAWIAGVVMLLLNAEAIVESSPVGPLATVFAVIASAVCAASSAIVPAWLSSQRDPADVFRSLGEG